MHAIELVTSISAPVERCFDLARSIDLHVESMRASRERAIAGVTSGLIGPNEQVTWEGRHFGIRFTLTSRITAYSRPSYFRDSMIAGPFASFVHDHHFDPCRGMTVMRDHVAFESPMGYVGALVDRLILGSYLRRLIASRNDVIKRAAERDGSRSTGDP